MSKVKLMGKNQHIKSISGHKTAYNWYIHEPGCRLYTLCQGPMCLNICINLVLLLISKT